MKYKMILFFLSMTACDPFPKKTPSVDSTATKNEESKTKFGTAAAFDTQPSEAQVTTLTYDKASHSLSLALKYSGCKEAAHSLSLEVCALSFPMNCTAQLVRSTDFDGSCEKLIEQSFVYALDKDFDSAYVAVVNKGGQRISILVDKNDALKAPQ